MRKIWKEQMKTLTELRRKTKNIEESRQMLHNEKNEEEC